jgi:hypothetical protein
MYQKLIGTAAFLLITFGSIGQADACCSYGCCDCSCVAAVSPAKLRAATRDINRVLSKHGIRGRVAMPVGRPRAQKCR